MTKVSILVPICNVEKFLDKCLQSLINQSLDNMEIICINDGSKDNSSSIIKKYADDWLDLKAIELLVDCIEKERADMVVFNFYAVKNEKKRLIYTVINDYYTTEEIKHSIIMDRWINFLWDKFYKKEIFYNIRLPIGHAFAEDAYIMPEVLSACKKIVCIKDGLYYYNRGNLGNVTQNLNSRNIYELFLTWKHRIDSGYALTDEERKICVNLAENSGIKACYLNLIKPFLSENELDVLQKITNKRIIKSPITILKAWVTYYKLILKKVISRNYYAWVFWKNYKLKSR